MFDNVSPQVLVALASAILAAVVSLTSVYLTNLNNRKTEKDKFEMNRVAEREKVRRGKLEELFLLFSKWDADMVALGHFYLRVITGETNEDEALVNVSKNQISEKDYLQRITMMIDLYFSDLKTDFDKVLDARESVWSFCSKIMQPGVRIEDFIKVQEEFRGIAKEFKAKMAKITNER